ncbi:MAG: hypothetical protein WCB57_14865 [Pseudonocardiaceae bacterium]
MTTPIGLLTTLSTHLAAFELPAIASVHVTAAIPEPQVTVQLPHLDPATLTQGLLAWVDTLTEVTAEMWRVPQGDSVHLSVTGLLSSGAAVRVYGGVRVTDRGLGADLDSDTTTTLRLTTLRHLANPGQAWEEVTL